MTEAGGKDSDGRDTQGMIDEKLRPAGPGETGTTRFGMEGDDTDGEGSTGVVEESGLATGLQPSGTIPGGGGGNTEGAIGTGGGSNDNRDTGTLKRWDKGQHQESGK
jgi:hypothetical protein